MKKPIRILNALLTGSIVLVISGSGCASHAPVPDASSPSTGLANGGPPSDWHGASIDIRYHLGHTHRHMVLDAKDQVVQAQSSVDGSVLKQNQIPLNRAGFYFAKVRDFVEKRRGLASTSSVTTQDCHDRYTVIFKNANETQQIDGCRTQDEGAFSHLINDGEFLINH